MQCTMYVHTNVLSFTNVILRTGPQSLYNLKLQLKTFALPLRTIINMFRKLVRGEARILDSHSRDVISVIMSSLLNSAVIC